jgi:hypothetical protein
MPAERNSPCAVGAGGFPLAGAGRTRGAGLAVGPAGRARMPIRVSGKPGPRIEEPRLPPPGRSNRRWT